jgi:hypothetical protein
VIHKIAEYVRLLAEKHRKKQREAKLDIIDEPMVSSDDTVEHDTDREEDEQEQKETKVTRTNLNLTG